MTAQSTQPEPEGPVASKRRRLQGVVIRRSGDKTVAVEISRRLRHRLYGKQYTHSKRYLVHDPENSAEVGSTVTIEEARPLSARKRWRIV